MNDSTWNGYVRHDFQFENRDAIIIEPKNPREDKRWLLKTEYFGAFPNFELGMLERGYYLCHLSSTTRWTPQEDIDARAHFAKYLHTEMGFYEKCLPVGMSCGGMQGIYLGARYPEVVAALYLDAPVVNLLSCPCGIGISTDNLYEEFKAHTGKTMHDLINCRTMPFDFIPKLIENRIPLFLVCGDSDHTVPYTENGIELTKAYEKSDVPFTLVLKPGCDHHPHSLDDLSPLYAFAEKYYS